MGQRMRARSGHGITGKFAAEYIEGVAKAMGTDFKKAYGLERARDVLSNGTPISKIVREMRDSQ